MYDSTDIRCHCYFVLERGGDQLEPLHFIKSIQHNNLCSKVKGRTEAFWEFG